MRPWCPDKACRIEYVHGHAKIYQEPPHRHFPSQLDNPAVVEMQPKRDSEGCVAFHVRRDGARIAVHLLPEDAIAFAVLLKERARGR